MASKYAALDAAILSAIGAGPQNFTRLLAGTVGDEARRHETRKRPDFRVLGARLQALRKSGRIKSVRIAGIGAAWVLVGGGAA